MPSWGDLGMAMCRRTLEARAQMRDKAECIFYGLQKDLRTKFMNDPVEGIDVYKRAAINCDKRLTQHFFPIKFSRGATRRFLIIVSAHRTFAQMKFDG